MVLANLIVLTAILAGLIYYYFKSALNFWKAKNVLTIPPTIPFGNTKSPFRPREPLHAAIAKLYDLVKAKNEDHGGFYLFAKPLYVPVNPDLLRHIYAVDFNHFVNRGVYFNEVVDPLSANMFALEGQVWKNLRAKLTPTFTSGKMKSMFFIMTQSADNMIAHINDEILPKTNTMNVKHVMGSFTTDIIGSAAFGLECNSFKDPDSPFLYHSKLAFKPTVKDQIRGMMGFVLPKLARKLNLPVLNTELTTFFMNLIKRTVDYRKKNNVVRKDFLQLLIDLMDDKEDPMTFNELAAQCFVFFIAGYETSSSTMSFALYEMALNKEVQAKAREEVMSVLKQHKGELTYDGIMEMKYLQQVVDETLRKYPPIPVLFRRVTKTYKVPGHDLILDEGQDVFIPAYSIHHDPEYYPNPEIFDPDRFTSENKQSRKHFTYMPFGDGPRNCVGLRFGLLQAKVGLALLLKTCDISINPLTPVPLEIDPLSFVLAPKNDILLNIKLIKT